MGARTSSHSSLRLAASVCPGSRRQIENFTEDGSIFDLVSCHGLKDSRLHRWYFETSGI